MKNGIGKNALEKFVEYFFGKELVDIKGLRRFWIKWTRISAITAKESLKNKISLRAASLTYVTLVSIVPVFAFAFSIGKGLGFSDKLKAFLISKVAASTALHAGDEASGVSFALDKVFNYIEKTNFETLGAIGVITLIYLVIQLLGSIETTFNDIWGVTVQRSLRRKFTDYISVVVIFPFFVLSAATFTAALASHRFTDLLYAKGSIGFLIKTAISYSSYIFLWIAFFALYMFMPNTKVKFSSALAGGIIGGTSWEIIQWVYFHFQIGISNYNVIYSTMAALPIFLLWIYLSWEILLFGAEVSFAHQTVGSYRFRDKGKKLQKKAAEILALSIVFKIANNFADGKKPFGIKHLSDSFGVRPDVIKPVIDNLKENEILYDAAGEDRAYLLAVPSDKLSAWQVVEAVSGNGETGPSPNFIEPEVYTLYEEMNDDLRKKYQAQSIADLLSHGRK